MRFVLLASTVIAVACGDGGGGPTAHGIPAVLRDTTEATFEPGSDGLRTLVPLQGADLPPACGGEAPSQWEYWPGKTGIATICVTDPDTGGPIDASCRPLACDAHTDCPADPTAINGCVDGICQCDSGNCQAQDGAGRVDDGELVALCLAYRPRTTMCPWGIEDADVAQIVDSSCGSEAELCEVPEECQP